MPVRLSVDTDIATQNMIVRAVLPMLDVQESQSLLRETVNEMCKAYAEEWLDQNKNELTKMVSAISAESLGGIVKEVLIAKLTTEEV